MESLFKRSIRNNKRFLSIYGFWLLFMFTLVIVLNKNKNEGLLPFHGGLVESGMLEFLFYLSFPIICFGIWKLYKKLLKIVRRT